jgi:hypothetical protein
LYDPISGSFTSTGSMKTARTYHTATRLPNGKVLVAGGFLDNSALKSAELYDPSTGAWTDTDPLPVEMYEHTATLLASGKVLVAGGLGPKAAFLASAAVFDPASGPNGKWTEVGSMNRARRIHSATLLPNEKVLIAGGQEIGQVQLNSAELFDPTSGKWMLTKPLKIERVAHIATLLPEGKVLVAGGQVTNFNVIDIVELYDIGLDFTSSWQPGCD